MDLRCGQFWIATLFGVMLVDARADDLRVVQIYPIDELAEMIERNEHLTIVVQDDCQLVQDIQARAEIMMLPTYQFLWGDMLAWGVCVDKNTKLGMHYIEESARQGFPPAFEQLGRYYAKGIILQQDRARGYIFLMKAARLGLFKAQLQVVELILDGEGSPLDYIDAYRWLHFSTTGQRKQHQQAQELLKQLALKMPKTAVEQAKSKPYGQNGINW